MFRYVPTHNKNDKLPRERKIKQFNRNHINFQPYKNAERCHSRMRKDVGEQRSGARFELKGRRTKMKEETERAEGEEDDDEEEKRDGGGRRRKKRFRKEGRKEGRDPGRRADSPQDRR